MAETFEAALERFRGFVQQSGYPRNLAWLTPDRVIGPPGKVYVRSLRADGGEHLAREVFHAATSQNRRVLFEALFHDGVVTSCHAWLARDNDQAARFMMPKEGLKMSVSTGEHRPKVQMVNSRILWVFLRLRYRRYQHLRDWLFNIER